MSASRSNGQGRPSRSTSRKRPTKAQLVHNRKVRGIGFTGHQRPKRLAMTVEQHAAKVRLNNPGWTDARVFAEAKRMVSSEVANLHPRAAKQYDRLAPTSVSPNRRIIVDLVEQAAIRRTSYGRAIRRTLASARGGRQTDRALPVAVFERLIYERDAPQLEVHRRQFMENNALLHWAYDNPASANCGHSTSAMNATLRAALDHHHPVLLIAANIEALKELAQEHPDLGRHLAVDGTNIIAPCEQRPSYSKFEEELLASELGASFVFHAKGTVGKFWRGWTLTILVCLKTGLPLVWVLHPAHEREVQHLREMLDLLFKYWPDLTPETLSSDKAFDTEEATAMLERDYGIHPVMPLRAQVAQSYPWVADGGVPSCAAHGVMEFVQSDSWADSADRLAAGLAPGEPHPDYERFRLRFACKQCSARATTRPRDNARLYTFLPRAGDHKRVGLRIALQYRHNQSESVNSTLKNRGLGHRGRQTPQWVRSDRQMEWYTGGSCLALTLRRLVHHTDTYAVAHADADALGLLAPPGGPVTQVSAITRGQQGLNRGAGRNTRRQAPNLAAALSALTPPSAPGRLAIDSSSLAVAEGERATRAVAREEAEPASSDEPAAEALPRATDPQTDAPALTSPPAPAVRADAGARFGAGLQQLRR